MKLIAKLSLSAVLLSATTTVLAYYFLYTPEIRKHPTTTLFIVKNIDKNAEVFVRLKQKALLAKDFAKDNYFNETRCFLIDMRVASGLKRFFVYNLGKDSIEAAGLVTHGTGSDKGVEKLSFSNIPNSNATSLGRYRIGKPYYGQFGLAYKLYGLDETNDKAFERFVVLHGHRCVPNEEVSPLNICESWGCPTIAPAFLKVLKTYIDNSSKPVLLWIYY